MILKVSGIGAAMEETQEKGLQLVANLKTGGLEEAHFHPGDSHGVMIVLYEYESKHGATSAASQR